MLEFPRSMLPDTVTSEGSTLVIKDLHGVRRIVAPEALNWTDTSVAVTTSQLFGEWLFEETASTADPTGDASYLVITTSGLMSSESLRYQIMFLQQRLLGERYEVRLPDQVINQKITGNEKRFVSAPAGTAARFAIVVLEDPVNKTCSLSSEIFTKHVEKICPAFA